MHWQYERFFAHLSCFALFPSLADRGDAGLCVVERVGRVLRTLRP